MIMLNDDESPYSAGRVSGADAHKISSFSDTNLPESALALFPFVQIQPL